MPTTCQAKHDVTVHSPQQAHPVPASAAQEAIFLVYQKSLRRWTHDFLFRSRKMGSKLREAFEEDGFIEHAVEPLSHWMCCMSCGHAEAERNLEDGDLYVFFTAQDTGGAVACGHLWLAYGCVGGDEGDLEVAACLACDALDRSGLEVDWSGDVAERICVTVGAEDKAWLQTFLDADQAEAEALWEEEMEEEARTFRLSSLMTAWRRGKFRMKIAAKRIAEAVVDHESRPGGVLYKRARARFEEVQK